jgi:hypothetical protein
VAATLASTIARQRDAATAACGEWNANYPVGQPVLYWPLEIGTGTPVTTTTRYTARPLAGQDAVVWLEGIAGAVALDHVEPIRQVVTGGPADTAAGSG